MSNGWSDKMLFVESEQAKVQKIRTKTVKQIVEMGLGALHDC